MDDESGSGATGELEDRDGIVVGLDLAKSAQVRSKVIPESGTPGHEQSGPLDLTLNPWNARNQIVEQPSDQGAGPIRTEVARAAAGTGLI